MAWRYGDFICEFGLLTEDQFTARIPWPCLIMPDLPSADGVFRTRPSRGLTPLEELNATYWVRPVAKRPEANSFPHGVTLGRLHSNDLPVPHATVSSFHAYLSEGRTGWQLWANRSTNGTYVDEKPVEAGHIVDLGWEAAIRFGGEITLRFLVPRALYVEATDRYQQLGRFR